MGGGGKDAKELVLGVRETLMHIDALRRVVQAAEIGAIIMPPMPAFYHQPETIQDIVVQTVNRILDQFDIQLENALFKRWQEAK